MSRSPSLQREVITLEHPLQDSDATTDTLLDDFDQGHLCERCQQLNLSPTSRERDPRSDFGPEEEFLEHGSLSCPFCRLVMIAYSHSWQNCQEANVILNWNSTRGFHFSNDGERIVFVDTGLATALLPHEGGRAVDAQIDPRLVQSWISTCDEHHNSDCQPRTDILYPPRGLKLLRLIDVQKKRLVRASEGCRYVALSYLWGGATAVSLTQENEAQLSENGGLHVVEAHLPKTIADAMALVFLIGERYLWVDSLCILQDDPVDQADGIQKMDLVYQGAIFTIVAAAGTDSNAGLPGVHPSSRDVDQVIEEVLPGVLMTYVNSMFTVLSESRYMTRGWTYQEFILSPRNVIFLDNRVYFQCHKGVWSEDTIYEKFPSIRNEATGSSQSVARPRRHDTDPWGTFVLLLFRYTQRQLTYNSDFLKAMAGILNQVCSQMKCGHLEGLPTACFDLGLLHWSYGGARERHDQFPSWSWAGWTGMATSYAPQWDGFDCGLWLEQQTYITWYARDPTGVLRPVWDPQPDSVFWADDIGYHRRSSPVPPCVSASSYDHLRYPIEPRANIPEERLPIKYTILQFWAQTITLSLEVRSDFETIHTDFTAIQNSHCQHCGFVRLDSQAEAQKATKRTFEAVILSKSAFSNLGGKPMSPNSPVRPERPFYWVIVIAWNHGMAERKGLGYLFQDCVEGSRSQGVVWKEIVLS